MTVRREIYKTERIVPVRFTRTAAAVVAGTSAPDPDDRGFTGYHGPVAGVCRGDTARIRVVRDLLDDGAPLFVTSEDAAKLTIISPAAGVALAAGHEVDIEFRAAATDGDVKVQVRAQRVDGPIVGELTVHVSQVVTVRCAIHRTAIFAPPATRAAANTTTRTFADITNLLAEVNRQWRPAGVRFLADTQRDNSNLINQVARNGIAPADGSLLCPVFGSGEANENFSRLMATNPVANRLNLHFVRQIRTASADGSPFYIGFGSRADRGLVVSDSADAIEIQGHTLAHELGHILNLAGRGHDVPEDSHSDDDPQFNMDVRRRRHDLWSRRRLMYYMVGLAAADRTGAASGTQSAGRYPFDGLEVGYGNGNVGHMLTIKNLVQDPTDNEYTDARNGATGLFGP